MQDIDALFIANPFAARSFLCPLLAFGAFASAALTIVDWYALFGKDVSLCTESETNIWASLQLLWVAVQFSMQVVQAPIRFYLMHGLYLVDGSLDEASEKLGRLTHSKCWAVNKQLGAVHAAWCAAGIFMLYALPTSADAPQCATGRRVLQLHVATFTLRCVMTIFWFAMTFAREMPTTSHQPESSYAAAKQLVDELPTIVYRAGGGDQRFSMTTCCMCLCEHEEGEELRVLGCGHYWHAECLSRWLAHRRTCPLCQRWDARPPSRQLPAQPPQQPAAAAAPPQPVEQAEDVGAAPRVVRRRQQFGLDFVGDD